MRSESGAREAEERGQLVWATWKLEPPGLPSCIDAPAVLREQCVTLIPPLLSAVSGDVTLPQSHWAGLHPVRLGAVATGGIRPAPVTGGGGAGVATAVAASRRSSGGATTTCADHAQVTCSADACGAAWREAWAELVQRAGLPAECAQKLAAAAAARAGDTAGGSDAGGAAGAAPAAFGPREMEDLAKCAGLPLGHRLRLRTSRVQ